MVDKIHYWCPDCNIPLLKSVCLRCGYDSDIVINDDLKPVFKKEYEVFSKHTQFPRRFPKVLYKYNNNLISDISQGKIHYKIKVEGNKEKAGYFNLDVIDSGKFGRGLEKEYFLENEEYLIKLRNGNLQYLQEIEKDALDFIKGVSKKYDDHYQICSFSGGKDSAVTAYLVKKALGVIPIVYSDTGIEFPITIKYVNDHGPFFGELTYLDKQVDFLEMCKQLGPPSRTMRWCCFTSKGAPLSKYYAEMEHTQVLSFDGIRSRESNARSHYSKERDNTKYEKQFSAYPILDWTTLEIWLYMLCQWDGKEKIPYNPLYDYGFSRVGCWACPNNTNYDWFVLSQVSQDLTEVWRIFIDDYRRSQSIRMGEDRDYDVDWLADGDWKKRRVVYYNDLNLVSLTENEDQSSIIELKYPIRPNLKEFLKVFGKIQLDSNGTSPIEVKIHTKRLEISYTEGSTRLEYKIKSEKNPKELKKLIFRQINKSFNCINCSACVGSCPYGAIYIDTNHELMINGDKCKHCLICAGTKYIDLSCIAIHFKQDRIYIKLTEI
jgi:phosphoadenosine phosphosulfate reductase